MSERIITRDECTAVKEQSEKETQKMWKRIYGNFGLTALLTVYGRLHCVRVTRHVNTVDDENKSCDFPADRETVMVSFQRIDLNSRSFDSADVGRRDEPRIIKWRTGMTPYDVLDAFEGAISKK